MANIENQPINILLSPNGEQASVTVVAEVTFEPNESPIGARLNCRVLGDDPLRDDFLFSYSTHFFTSFGNQEVRFERNDISRSLLNEDIIGADEIVGELQLNLPTGTQIKKRTNVFQLR